MKHTESRDQGKVLGSSLEDTFPPHTHVKHPILYGVWVIFMLVF